MSSEKSPFLSGYRPNPMKSKEPVKKVKQIILTTKDINQDRIPGRKCRPTQNYKVLRWKIFYIRGKTIHASYVSRQRRPADAIRDFAKAHPTAKIKVIQDIRPSGRAYSNRGIRP